MYEYSHISFSFSFFSFLFLFFFSASSCSSSSSSCSDSEHPQKPTNKPINKQQQQQTANKNNRQTKTLTFILRKHPGQLPLHQRNLHLDLLPLLTILQQLQPAAPGVCRGQREHSQCRRVVRVWSAVGVDECRGLGGSADIELHADNAEEIVERAVAAQLHQPLVTEWRGEWVDGWMNE